MSPRKETFIMKTENNFRNSNNNARRSNNNRGSYNRGNNNGRRGGGYNNRNHNNPFERAQREENNRKKQEVYDLQTQKLALIKDAVEYLNNMMYKSLEECTNINYMVAVNQYLIEEKKYEEEFVRHNVNQLRPLADLAWAQKKCTFMTPERIKIRVDYIREIYKTMCMQALHAVIDEIIDPCSALFFIGAKEENPMNHVVLEDKKEEVSNAENEVVRNTYTDEEEEKIDG